MIIHFEKEELIYVTKCPNDKDRMVCSESCRNCFYFGGQTGVNTIYCHYDEVPREIKQSIINWRKCQAGYKFPSDAIVIPDDERTTDRDPRLVRCAVWDSKYILVDDLKKLPVDNG